MTELSEAEVRIGELEEALVSERCSVAYYAGKSRKLVADSVRQDRILDRADRRIEALTEESQGLARKLNQFALMLNAADVLADAVECRYATTRIAADVRMDFVARAYRREASK